MTAGQNLIFIINGSGHQSFSGEVANAGQSATFLESLLLISEKLRRDATVTLSCLKVDRASPWISI